ncbi:hypothetical protein C8A03DRAFT_16496, partial [Achaetomium macrosporum]
NANYMAPKEVACAHRARGFVNTRRLVVCCDGTWNDANQGSGPPTNVSRLSGAFAQKCCSGMPQVVYYHRGAGTETSKVAHLIGGAFGVGVAQHIADSYRFICDNYNPGDEIIIIGFSRGAFTARSVGDMVCALAFLNRTGLDQLPHIFRDYRHWNQWHKEPFDEDKHLVGITLENLKKLKRFEAWKKRTQTQSGMTNGGAAEEVTQLPSQSEESLAKELRKRKKELYEQMAAMVDDGKPDVKAIAAAYRDMLAEYKLLVDSLQAVPPGSNNFQYVPIKDGHVKAIGVWDTVGSLGIPKIPPFYHSRRRDEEIRFASLDVDAGVEYAFHAIALDEWRTPFDCTMWGRRDNRKTQLRQVWFPGTHNNVGGGWEDQQIATIALAWMADQLTSIGVEFSRPEMKRIFYDILPKAKARKWGMGVIRNPDVVTSYPDRIWGYIAAPVRLVTKGTTDYPTRTPGGYKEDNGKEKLVDPNELVHPCVRIRYLYGGLTMDDKGPWTCRALTERGYRLERRDTPATAIRESRVPSAVDPYLTVRGPVTPYYDTPPAVSTAGTDDHPFVKVQQPGEDELYQLPEPRSYWVWKHKNGSELPEEHIGMWERMFIKINEKLVRWQERADAAAPREQKSLFQRARGAIRRVFDAIKSPFVSVRQPPMTEAAKRKDKYIPETYGYHDFVSWQKGDTKKVATQA